MDRALINYEFAKSLGLSQERIVKLEKLHLEMNKISDEQRQFIGKSVDTQLTKEWDAKIREIEYEMQETWGFGKNDNMLRYWLEQPLCTCPKRDNYERLGTGQRIINTSCPIHGE